jgi:acetylornithine deacetylase/succinyl-diaminopimelate desuccinylase-like protein
MNGRFALVLAAAALSFGFGFACPALAQPLTPQQQLAFDIFKELVEINAVTAIGDTARAADAMAARLRAAGFSGDDVQVFKPAPRKGNLVARLRGTGARKPILLMAHLDVVEALASDWSFDPFKLTEKDGYFYGRGTGGDKFMAAAFVATVIRYKQENFTPNRDIILALETDEEIGDSDGLGIQWLFKNHRDLIEASTPSTRLVASTSRTERSSATAFRRWKRCISTIGWRSSIRVCWEINESEYLGRGIPPATRKI